mgnify:CR=1 FL=1
MKLYHAAFVVIAMTGVAHAEDISLVCQGSGRYPTSSTSSVTTWNYSTGQPSQGSATHTEVQSVNANIRFELRGERARILMPPVMTPTINNGSDGGWWNFDRLEVTENEISGRFNLNVFNKPRVRIDRRTGVIEVDGNFNYYFLGECQRDETPVERRF